MKPASSSPILVSAILGLAFTFISCLSFASNKPNVLMIAVDDLRPAIAAYGDKRAITPNIDNLAQNGLSFTRAYTNVPVCGASRASLMTSVRPTPKRFINFLSRAETDAPGAKSIPQIFKESGYYTISNGKVFHHADDLDEESWSESAWIPEVSHAAYFHPDSKNHINNKFRNFGPLGPWYEAAEVEDDTYFDGQVRNKTLSDLERMKAMDKPFFLAAGFFRPHLPFYTPKKYYDLYADTDIEPHYLRNDPFAAPKALKGSREITMYSFKDYAFNSDDFHRSSILGYYACVSYVDKLIGDIIAKLKALDLYDNTVIVLWSDHGFHLGEHNYWGKHNLLQSSIRIPLIVRHPHKTAMHNQKSDTLVELVDLFPSLAEIAGIALEQKVQQQLSGSSFAAHLDGNSPGKKYIYTRFKTGETIVSQRFSYTEYTDKKGKKEAMLYDLKFDPDETVNIVSNPRYADVVENHRHYLQMELAKLK